MKTVPNLRPPVRSYRVSQMSFRGGGDSKAPCVCIVEPCSFSRLGLASLAGGRNVVALASGSDWLSLPLCQRVRPVSVLVYRLQEALAPLMDGLDFLRDFLTQSQRWADPPRVLLLSDVPPYWLYNTLNGLMGKQGGGHLVSVISAHSTTAQVVTALKKNNRAALLINQAGLVPSSCRRSGLTAGEVGVLRDLLAWGISILQQARWAGVSPKTRYSQQHCAMRKLGVRALVGLVRWDVRDWSTFR